MKVKTELIWTAFTITGPDQTYHASRFIFSSFFSLIFLFVPCGGLRWLHTSAFYRTLNIVSYRKRTLWRRGALLAGNCYPLPKNVTPTLSVSNLAIDLQLHFNDSNTDYI